MERHVSLEGVGLVFTRMNITRLMLDEITLRLLDQSPYFVGNLAKKNFYVYKKREKEYLMRLSSLLPSSISQSRLWPLTSCLALENILTVVPQIAKVFLHASTILLTESQLFFLIGKKGPLQMSTVAPNYENQAKEIKTQNLFQRVSCVFLQKKGQISEN